MILIRRIRVADACALKETRLAALQESPLAFGSTYAVESRLTEMDWERRASRCEGARETGYLSWDGATVCGIVGGVIDRDDPTKAELISMWVAPGHRTQGVGRLLVDA